MTCWDPKPLKSVVSPRLHIHKSSQQSGNFLSTRVLTMASWYHPSHLGYLLTIDGHDPVLSEPLVPCRGWGCRERFIKVPGRE